MPVLGTNRLRPVAHDEQLSVVAHLDELRTRLLVSLAVVAAAFAVCFWQNHWLLSLVNKPLAHQTQAQVRVGHGLRPLLPAIPGLFVLGVAFGYFAVLPAAVRFFQNFNSGQFDVLVQASQYYKFAATTLLAMGLLFELPVVIVAVTRAGVISTRRLRRSRRYAVAACALVAAFLPGDAVTMLLETVPLYLLFEFSLLVARVAERRAERVRSAVAVEPSA